MPAPEPAVSTPAPRVRTFSPLTRTIPAVGDAVVAARRRAPGERSLLVAISGIDGSGKGYVAARLADDLAGRGTRVAVLNVDGWLNLPHVRFDRAEPAEGFYRHALRLDEMFSRLVLPLRDHRSVSVEADFAEETATEYRRHRWELHDVDVILLEGIYLLKRDFRAHHDLSFWVDCTFETALERALARRQEGLSEAETVAAYGTIYFPAQRIHFARDAPREAATAVVVNDPRLA